MKKPLQTLLLSSLIILGACKKSEQPLRQNNDASATLSTSTGLPRLSVITIAGLKILKDLQMAKVSKRDLNFHME